MYDETNLNQSKASGVDNASSVMQGALSGNELLAQRRESLEPRVISTIKRRFGYHPLLGMLQQDFYQIARIHIWEAMMEDPTRTDSYLLTGAAGKVSNYIRLQKKIVDGKYVEKVPIHSIDGKPGYEETIVDADRIPIERQVDFELIKELLPKEDFDFLMGIYGGKYKSLRDLAKAKKVTHPALVKKRNRLLEKARKKLGIAADVDFED